MDSSQSCVPCAELLAAIGGSCDGIAAVYDVGCVTIFPQQFYDQVNWVDFEGGWSVLLCGGVGRRSSST